MDENKLKEIIKDLWSCIREDTFSNYLYHKKGLEAREINRYIEFIKNL